VSSLSFEQLVFLIILVGIPLARVVVRWLRSQVPAAASPASRLARAESFAEDEDLPFVATSPSQTPSLSWSRVSEPEAQTEAVTVRPKRGSRRQAPSQPPIVIPAGGSVTAAARTLLRARARGVHQAVVLATIIGPPRALEPWGSCSWR
jgi:hypothetical protein